MAPYDMGKKVMNFMIDQKNLFFFISTIKEHFAYFPVRGDMPKSWFCYSPIINEDDHVTVDLSWQEAEECGWNWFDNDDSLIFTNEIIASPEVLGYIFNELNY